MSAYSKQCENHKELLLKMAHNGATLADMTRASGVKGETIKKFLILNGFQKDWKAVSACQKNRDLVIGMAQDGVSIKKIAEAVGTCRSWVRRFLKQNGIHRVNPPNYGGERASGWKGGVRRDNRGYIHIWSPNHPNANHAGYVQEHRLVMEKMIGRYLLPKEVVHHKNAIRGDNRPENLQLFPDSGSHLRHELTGRTPQWTEDGLERMRQSRFRVGSRRHEESLWKSWKDGQPWI